MKNAALRGRPGTLAGSAREFHAREMEAGVDVVAFAQNPLAKQRRSAKH